jgi:hypothetical protein
MSDHPNFPKADHALQVLRQARLSRNETAAIMVEDLVDQRANTVLRTPRNRGSAPVRLGRNFRLGECSQRRRVTVLSEGSHPHEELISAIGFDDAN